MLHGPRNESNLTRSRNGGAFRLRRFFVAASLAWVALFSPKTTTAHAQLEPHADWLAEPIRGVTISCFRWGPGEWDGPHMADALDELKSLGANWVTIHPYAQVTREGRLRWSPQDASTVEHTARLAKERGMRVMIKPHLAYWRAGFGWRGDIVFPDAAHETQFWRDYETWMLHHAMLAQQHDVDLLVVGVELKQFHDAGHESHWRRIIRRTRKLYGGPLTYAANWDDYTHVRFWDALDAIGVQGYFPLVGEENMSPTDDELRAGWVRVRQELHAYRQALGLPLLLTELGYATSTAAASRPWDWHQAGEPDAGHDLKARSLKTGLDAVASEPAIAGAFLWKWFATPHMLDHEFHLQYPKIKSVIREKWRS
ncbi:MAG: hypothetical protein AAGE65_02715 [Planctomycetota bacterium]